MKQSKEPSLLVKTVRCSVSENNCRHPFWPRFNVSIICTLWIVVRETNRLLVELGHMLEYNLATAHWMASHPSVHSGLLHTYPDIIESTTISLRIQKIPRPHLSGFTVVPRTPLGILATEHASERRVRAELRAREKTWERGYPLEYSIHGKELGWILLRHRKKISGFSIHTIPYS